MAHLHLSSRPLQVVSTHSGLCSWCLRRWQRGLQSQIPPLQRLMEVGRLESPKLHGHYQPGQFFLHHVFGYRGVILFPWVARVYDRDVLGADSNPTTWEEEGVVYDHIKGLRGENKTYYQAIIDQRDFPYIRTQPEAITFLADNNDSSLYSIPGLDYVSHEDVLPYTPTEQEPVHHELFGQFLAPSLNSNATYVPLEALSTWREKNHRWLELTDVHRQATKGIRVTVMPFYIGCREMQQSSKIYWWRYNIRLENLSGERVQLKERHWRIFSHSGTLETIKGKGVIGQEPVLSPSMPAFHYSSHVSLQSASGYMWGTFRMEKQDRSCFDIRVPPFSLESHKDSNQQ